MDCRCLCAWAQAHPPPSRCQGDDERPTRDRNSVAAGAAKGVGPVLRDELPDRRRRRVQPQPDLRAGLRSLHVLDNVRRRIVPASALPPHRPPAAAAHRFRVLRCFCSRGRQRMLVAAHPDGLQRRRGDVRQKNREARRRTLTVEEQLLALGVEIVV